VLLREQLELAPQGCKAAGLDLDQQVAADEVDDETAGDLLEQVARTAVPFLQLRVERALVERPDLHHDAPSPPVPRCLRPHCLRVRGIERVRLHADLVMLARLALAVSCAKPSL